MIQLVIHISSGGHLCPDVVSQLVQEVKCVVVVISCYTKEGARRRVGKGAGQERFTGVEELVTDVKCQQLQTPKLH